MQGKILVAYASKCGSTGEVAQAIGEALEKMGAAVEVRPVQEVSSLDGYGAVVIGSAVRAGRWLPEATAFVQRRRTELARLPAAIFSLHMLARDESEASRAQRLSFADAARAILSPKAEAFFAGRINPSRMSFMARLMTKAVKAKEEDLRDWNAIREWAEGLYPILVQA